jgi:hypothetical protein
MPTRRPSSRACSLKVEWVRRCRATTELFAHERPGERADLIDTYWPGLPALALDYHPPSRPLELQIDVAVRSLRASGLPNLPSLPSEQLTDEPLELGGTEQTKVGGPVEELTALTRYYLVDEPSETQNSGEKRGAHVRFDEVRTPPVQSQREGEPQSAV